MKHTLLQLLLIAALVACTVGGVDLQPSVEYQAIVRIPNEKHVVELIKRGLSLDHPNKKEHSFEAYITDKDVPLLKEFGVDFEIVSNEQHNFDKRANAAAYHDYNALSAFLDEIVRKYPTISRKFSIGKSVQGRELWGIQISDNITADEAEPQFKYIANMHGDEVVGREISLYFIDLLCSGYGTDARITTLINDTNIFIIPSMNPDGYERRQRGNANNVDLNRNFPDQFTSPANTKNGRQPETVAVMNFIEQHNFVLSANFHGGAVVANYPYDGNSDYRSGYYTPSPDDGVFKYLAQTYSDTHKKMHNSREFYGGITNGADWYVLYGGMQDWNYVYNQGVFEITIELSDDKWPAASQLASFWDDNKDAMLSYIELVHTLGFKGTVKNAAGVPLAASITVQGNSKVMKTNPAHGDYYRLLTPGTYTVTASSSGYEPSTTTIVIHDSQISQPVVDFILTTHAN